MNKLVVVFLASTVLFGFGMKVFAADPYRLQTVPGERTGAIRPAVKPPVEPPGELRYTCPSSAYINCMPPVEKSARDQCNPEYLKWAKSHCHGLNIVY
jgi:hypothetical protein